MAVETRTRDVSRSPARAGGITETGWERIGALAGVAFAVILVVVTFIPGASPPAASDSVATITKYFTAHHSALIIQGWLVGVSMLLGLYFLGTLRSILGRHEGGSSRVTTTAYGAGIAGLTMAMLAQIIISTATYKVAHAYPSAGLMTTLYGLQALIDTFVWFPLAVLVGGVSVVGRRTGMLPDWLSFGGAGAAIVMLVSTLGTFVDSGPLFLIGFVAYLLFLIWSAATGVVLYRRAGIGQSGAAAAA